MEQKRKQTEEALAEIYRNAQLALTSISDILPEVGEDMKLKQELHKLTKCYKNRQYRIYSKKSCSLFELRLVGKQKL